MNIEFFNKYLASIKSKDRIMAKKYIDKFIKSFTSYEEKEAFTKDYLSELGKKEYRHIRHELFVKIIFPVLLNGYNNRNIQCMIWIIEFIHTFRQHEDLWKQIGKKNEKTMLYECYEIAPNNDKVNKMYMEMKLKCINGFIHAMNSKKDDMSHYGSWILLDIKEFKDIDRNSIYNNALENCENEVREYLKAVEKLNEIRIIESVT